MKNDYPLAREIFIEAFNTLYGIDHLDSDDGVEKILKAFAQAENTAIKSKTREDVDIHHIIATAILASLGLPAEDPYVKASLPLYEYAKACLVIEAFANAEAQLDEIDQFFGAGGAASACDTIKKRDEGIRRRFEEVRRKSLPL